MKKAGLSIKTLKRSSVVAAFLLVVFGIDRLCSWLVGFIV